MDPRQGGSPSLSGPAGRTRILDGGVVAYNEERTLEPAVRSLLDQDLPDDLRWGTLWIVASGCTDSTVRIAEGLASTDSRVRLVVEADRSGKSHALREVLRRARGDLLVLLNADARAEPGALAALVRASLGAPTPFAVMARPVPPSGHGTRFERVVELLWNVHHELHLEVPIGASGTNLSDELMLLSLPQVPALRSGTINDGASLGVSVARNRGGVRYAPEALVRISTPLSFGDLLRQRRRIRTGYGQLSKEFGSRPMTLPRLFVADPRRAVRVLRRSLEHGDHRLGDLLALAIGETAGFLLATWDALPPRKDHVNWDRIHTPPPSVSTPTRGDRPAPATPRPTDARLETLLRVAGQYRSALAVDELVSLLTDDGPVRREEVLRWIQDRPDLARFAGDRIYPAGTDAATLWERHARAERYHGEARRLVDEDLAPVLRWVRCVGVTGSTAYGTPEAGDDLDLLVITQPGTLWVCLTYAYLAVRFRFLSAGREDRPRPCFNYVLDEEVARAEFSRPQGLLFAREALTARILRGEDYYGALLAGAPWLREELPRLYEGRCTTTDAPEGDPVPWALRALNSALFLPVAAYLHLVGLHRNARGLEQGESHGGFRVVTGPGRMALTTARFEHLRSEYEHRLPVRLGPEALTVPGSVERASPVSPSGFERAPGPSAGPRRARPTSGSSVPWNGSVPETGPMAPSPNDLAGAGAPP